MGKLINPITEDGLKCCGVCGAYKLLFEFRKAKRNKSGVGNVCKECHNSRTREFNKDNRGYLTIGKRAWRVGLTREEVEKATLFFEEIQGGVCAICGETENILDHRTGLTYALSLDHNHNTGKLRGLLCKVCNITIGRLKDNPTILRKAAEYLECE